MRLRYGYTNVTIRDGDIVTKHYRGADAAVRLIRELQALSRLAGTLPFPELRHIDPSVAIFAKGAEDVGIRTGMSNRWHTICCSSLTNLFIMEVL
jgi:hypothetical protein